MPITLPAQRLAFFFLPKVACTSFKHMFFEIENGRPFEPFQVNGKRQFVHDLYPFRRFAKLKPAQYEGFARLALLRDPVARVVSCYRNRVVAQKALALGDTPARLAAQGLSAKPSLEEFVAHFPAYRRASGAVRFHTQPLSHALGPDRAGSPSSTAFPRSPPPPPRSAGSPAPTWPSPISKPAAQPWACAT